MNLLSVHRKRQCVDFVGTNTYRPSFADTQYPYKDILILICFHLRVLSNRVAVQHGILKLDYGFLFTIFLGFLCSLPVESTVRFW